MLLDTCKYDPVRIRSVAAIYLFLYSFSPFILQEDNIGTEVSKREKARLREMQRLKKQKIQDILDQQNATIDADMVPLHFKNDSFLHYFELVY